MPDTVCLYSTVRNTSGKALVCSFLPPHGRTLAIGESISIFGDVRALLVNANGRVNARKQAALEAALLNNDIEITSTPSPIFYDDPLDLVKYIRVNNGTLGAIDPCYGSYSGQP